MIKEPAWIRWLGNVIDWILVVMGGLMVLITFYNVLSRYIFKADLAWSSEIVTFMLIWTSFIGGAAAVRRSAHLTVNELINRFSLKVRYWIDIYIQLVLIGFIAIMAYFGFQIVAGSMEELTMALKMPIGTWYAAMPVGAVCSIIFLINNMYRMISEGKTLAELMIDEHADKEMI
ncbi:TRAP transporter small permease [Paenibacillus ferrarius]|uniref:TRAP transporter small permease n=1 Tax=Paenibacillus ferrarius TaxID=1469647 RepID=UPI003D28B743